MDKPNCSIMSVWWRPIIEQTCTHSSHSCDGFHTYNVVYSVQSALCHVKVWRCPSRPNLRTILHVLYRPSYVTHSSDSDQWEMVTGGLCAILLHSTTSPNDHMW